MNKQSVLSSYQYQLKDTVRSVIIYYIVIVCVTALLGTSVTVNISNYGANSEAYSSTLLATASSTIFVASCIFLFVAGLNTFKENFGMLLQNGLSRKSVFWGRNLAAATLALGMAIIDTCLILLVALITWLTTGTDLNLQFSIWSLWKSTSQSLPSPVIGINLLSGIVLAFSMYLFYITVGYFITILFYRLNRTGKIIVGAGVPVFFTIVLPAIDGLFLDDRLLIIWRDTVTSPVNRLLAAYPALLILLMLLGACFWGLLCWLLMRKAIVRK